VQVVGELDVQPAHNLGHYETSHFRQLTLSDHLELT
jgi:hypothetical protein